MVAVRRMARRHFGRDHQPVYRLLGQLLTAIAWPLAVFWELRKVRYYREPETSTIKLVGGAFWAAMRHNVKPVEYYAYGLWRPERKLNIDNYLYSIEGTRLFRLLNRPSQPHPLDDKLAFQEMCKRYALPCPEILAAFTPAGKLIAFESGLPPKCDLFVKPRNGAGRDGVEHFRWRDAVFESSRCHRLRSEDLGRYLLARARTENRTLLVQPALSNHPDLRIGPNAYLATARLVSGLSTKGDVTPIFGLFHIFYFAEINQTPLARRVTLIDVANGRLRKALWESNSGAKRSNFRFIEASGDDCLPYWDTVLRQIKVAHRACSNFIFVGWDVAFTEHGPMLLEGNVNWDASDYQRLSGEPLCYTTFADILAARLGDFTNSAAARKASR
jgi:hypothetical protein